MGKFVLLASLVILGYLAHCGNGQDHGYDIYPPLQGLWTRIENIGGLKLDMLIGGVIGLIGNLPCLTPPSPSTMEHLKMIRAELPEIQLDFTNLTDILKKYVKTDDFKQIHYFLWDKDSEWSDVIELLYHNGFKDGNKNIYGIFKDVYAQLEASNELIGSIPDAPLPRNLGNTNNGIRQKRSAELYSRHDISSLAMLLKSIIIKQQEGCKGLIDAILQLLNSNILEWAELLKFLMNEINTNPAVHIFAAKMFEPIKGEGFVDFRNLNSTITLIHTLDTGLKNDLLFQTIIGILEGLTGINFSELKINVVGNLISFVQYLIWRTPFLLYPTA